MTRAFKCYGKAQSTKGDLATNRSGSRGFLSGRLGRPIVAVVVIGLLVFVAWLFLGLGGYTWRSEVSVVETELRSPDRLTLGVDSSHKDPEVSLLV